MLAEPELGVWQVKVRPHETLFRVGDSSEAGIFIVVEGRLGVFLQVGVAASRFTCPSCCVTGCHKVFVHSCHSC